MGPLCCRGGLSVLVACAALLLAGPTGASAAGGGMRVDAGRQHVSVVSSRSVQGGRLRSTWMIGGKPLTVTAPPGSRVVLGQNWAEVMPPLAFAGASWSNPCDHCWYNALQIRRCGETCVNASSTQFAMQEKPGAWYIGNRITGTVYPGSGKATFGQAWNRWISERGDSAPLDYQPNGDSCPSSGKSLTLGLSAFAVSLSVTVPLSGGSCFGPVAPSGWSSPAFGSRYWSGGQSGNHGLGSLDMIHLGHHQSPYDWLYISWAA